MLRSLFVFAILIPGVAAALTNRFAALLLYLWFALFRPMEWVWFDLSALRPSLVLGLLLVVPSFLTGVFPNLGHPLSVGSVMFLLAGLVAQTNAVSAATGWYWLDYLFRLLLVCLLATSLISDQRRFKLTMAVIAGSFGVHAAKAGLMSLLGGGTRFGEGLAGAFVDNNGYAVGMVMILPLLLGTAQNMSRPWVKRAFYIAVPFTALAVVSTFSRGGFLALAAAGLTITLLHRRRMLAFLAVGVLAIPLALFMINQEGYLDRLQTIRTYEERNESSALSRLHFWRVAVNMALDHPLGIGFFNYDSAYDRYDFLDGEFGRRRSVHSSTFQVLAETGFAGAAIFASLFVMAFRAAFRIRRRGLRQDLAPDDRKLFVTAGNALLASMAAFLVGGSFIAMALNDLTWMTFALVASLDLISARCVAQADAVSVPAVSIPSRRRVWQPVAQPVS
jgi:probable O-glycosylation ligase (exosortase A-associated)